MIHSCNMNIWNGKIQNIKDNFKYLHTVLKELWVKVKNPLNKFKNNIDSVSQVKSFIIMLMTLHAKEADIILYEI